MPNAHWTSRHNRIAFPTTYEQARDCYDARIARSRSGRVKLAHNTYLVKDTSDPLGVIRYGIKFHNTVIVLFSPSGWIKLNTGGWQTVTTRDRMRRAGIRIYTADGVAGVTLPDGREVAYRDGMSIRGNETHDAGIDAEEARRQRRKALRRSRTTGYVQRLSTRQFSEYIPGGNTEQGLQTPYDGQDFHAEIQITVE